MTRSVLLLRCPQGIPVAHKATGGDSGPGTMDSASAQTRDTYAEFGLAVYLAQVLEYALVNAMIVAQLPQAGAITRNDIDAFMAQEFKGTLGRLIRNLAVHVAVPTTLQTVLSDALEKRNWLAHHYFRERAEQFVTTTGRSSMIDELHTAQELFERADKELLELIKPMRERFGITDEKIEAMLGEIESRLSADGD
jgi:hypothetical protein